MRDAITEVKVGVENRLKLPEPVVEKLELKEGDVVRVTINDSETTILRVGTNFRITIPKVLCETLNVKKGDIVRIKLEKVQGGG